MSSHHVDFPTSHRTVRVRMVDTTTVMTIQAESFVEPVQRGHEVINITDVAFLIEHEPSGKKVMFDLGCRKDYWNLPAVIQKWLGRIIPALQVEKDTSEILEERGIDLKSITSVIWSHYHWDHTSNVSLFPPSTSLIVGPGFKSSPILLPGFPDQHDSPVSASDFAGRMLTEIDFSTSNIRIGGFSAHDFFGDGSFYLLDSPGHCIGHLCGFARTTPDPDSSFVLMGGDICHFAGDFRPAPAIPLPDPIPSGILDTFFPSPCPCSLFTDHHPLASGDTARTTPFYKVSTHRTSAYVDPATAQQSVDHLQTLDSHPSVLVCIAHDPTLLVHLPTLNTSPHLDLNPWKSSGWKDRCHWGWLNELPRAGQPGRQPIVEGFWRHGRRWDRAERDLREGGQKRQAEARARSRM